jgi:predicted nucleotidyltransferase component of viral defense system
LAGNLDLYNFGTLSNFESRATIDVDFLMKNLPSTIKRIKLMIEEILRTNTGNDFITFENMGYENILPQRKYSGVSFKLIGKIKNTRTPFSVDIGVGDLIIPSSQKIDIPTQLENFKVPKVFAYSLESTIAEKFDAIVQRLELTSRMKDYYDIYYICHAFNFESKKLRKAILETLKNRGTFYDEQTLDIIISFSKNNEMILKWNNFLKKLKFQKIEFSDVLSLFELFLKSIWDSIINDTEQDLVWNASKLKWE